MLQLYPVYLLWSRRKTLTGSSDPTRVQTVQINLANISHLMEMKFFRRYQSLLGMQVAFKWKTLGNVRVTHVLDALPFNMKPLLQNKETTPFSGIFPVGETYPLGKCGISHSSEMWLVLFKMQRSKNIVDSYIKWQFKLWTDRAAAAALKFWRLGWRLGMGLGLILEHHNVFQWDLVTAAFFQYILNIVIVNPYHAYSNYCAFEVTARKC